MNIFWRTLIEEKIVVHCPEFEQCCEVVDEYIRNVNPEDDVFNDNFYDSYIQETCIRFEKDTWSIANVDYYNDKEEFTVISYEDFIQEKIELRKKIDGMLLVLVGCSASGKDTIQDILVREKICLPIVSHTSRPMREGEQEGVNYHYISYEEAKIMLDNDKFIEHRIYNTLDKEKNKQTWIYGISKREIDNLDFDYNNYVVIVDYEGLKSLEEYMTSKGLGEKICSVFVKASSQARLVRSLNREGYMTEGQVSEVIRRFLDDKEKVEPAIAYCDVVLTNEKKNHLDRNVEILKIILG